MRTNPGLKAWNRPYLFQAMEQTYCAMPDGQKQNVINLGIGDPDLPTPKPIREAIIREHRSRYHGYPTSQGRKDLREALSQYYADRFHVTMHPDDIFIGPGAKTDLFDLNAVFAEPGDSVAILDPAYPVYRDAADFRRQKILFLSGNPENDFQPELNPNPDDLPLALIYLCYPNNPTGVTAREDYIQRMIDLALKFDTIIIMDIAYADFLPGNSEPTAKSIFEYLGGDMVGIEVGSFSKPFSMTGDRISWVAVKNPAARNVWHRFRSSRDSGVSNYDQAGALAALTNPAVKPIVRDHFEIYGKRAAILQDGFRKLGFPMTGLINTPYAWIQIPCRQSVEAARYILQHAGVMLTPGAGFGPAGEGFLRATIFQPEHKLAEAVERLRHIDFTQI